MKKINQYITPQQLLTLNNFIKLYYGNDINIFMIQGLMVSCMSSVTPCLPIESALLKYGTSVFPLQTQADQSELTLLLLDGLYSQTFNNMQIQEVIYPLKSITKFYTQDFNYTLLSNEEQHNVLDWYLGYFTGVRVLWDTSEIIKTYSTCLLEDSDGAQISAADMFVAALNGLLLLTNDLLHKLKPTYQNIELNKTIACVQKMVSEMPAAEKVFDDIKGQATVCKTLTTLMFLSEQIAPTIDRHHVSNIENICKYFNKQQKDVPPEIRDKIRESLKQLQKSGLLDVKTLGIDENGEDILHVEVLEPMPGLNKYFKQEATIH
jgi:hypothetical protein